MISAIIPVYNTEKYLVKCLSSVINQTYKDLEIILINDGSSDASDSICAEFMKTDKRIKYYNRTHKGQGAARNFGVQHAKGEYLAFLDADDWWDAKFAELMVQAAQKWDADVVLCDINYVYCERVELSEIRMPDDKPLYADDNPDLINRARTFLWGKLYKTDFYKSLGINQLSHIFEDMATVPFIIANTKRICRVAKPLQFYLRSRSDSITNQPIDVSHLLDSLEILKECFMEHGLFSHYYQALKKMAFSQIRYTVRKLNISMTGFPEQLNVMKNKLFSFMDTHYPDWVNIENKRFCVVGNEDQADIIRLLLFDDSKLTIVPNMGHGFRKEEYDYIFTDLPTGLSTRDKWDYADNLFYSDYIIDIVKPI